MELRVDLKEPSRADLAILAALRVLYPHLSRAQLRPWLKAGRFLVRGRAIRGSDVLDPGTHQVVVEGLTEHELGEIPRASASRVPLPVVYEDEDLLILNKPSGMPSVPHTNDETETAVGAALARHPELGEIGRGGFEPAILHRLDTGTSGLVVFARTEAEFQRLHALWKERRVRKFYKALTRGEGPPARTELPRILDLPLAHDARDDRRMIVVTPKTAPSRLRGRPLPAQTEIIGTREPNGGITELEIELKTGVMHQIRAHLAHLGWPLLGDKIYHGTPSHRLWLHAWRLELPLRSGVSLSVEAAMPERWPGTHVSK